ncbi:DUF2759 domain-containing protein [Calidifontibacillus oryziterrae]|uniref:DUF2759 domain-containing protein n=1 Tax=Calidifontibacillus oryziterrae TaxID=1191699 RepID=UPI0002E04468|nr:DUF2759 domain-containing protein [Calidifontibacillus oryziterrae]
MGLVIIFTLVTLLCAYGTLRSLKAKNMLGIFFAGASVLVFGWFTVMTFIGILGGHGVPGAH